MLGLTYITVSFIACQVLFWVGGNPTNHQQKTLMNKKIHTTYDKNKPEMSIWCYKPGWFVPEEILPGATSVNHGHGILST